MKEILWLGRGGQGAFTAAKLLGGTLYGVSPSYSHYHTTADGFCKDLNFYAPCFPHQAAMRPSSSRSTLP